jgi:predicted TPR repeat methyltransferase/lipoprotein NlpI
MPNDNASLADHAEPSAAQRLQQAMQCHGGGRLDEAEAAYRAVLAAEPANPDALHLLGVLQAQRGRHDEAAVLIAAAIAANPHEPMFHNNLGNVCTERGRLDEAEASYLRALQLDGSRVDALNNLGVLLGARGNADGAEQVLRRVIELAPGFADARQNLANHLFRCGRLPEAVQQCMDGLVVAPRSAVLRRLLGVSYSMLGMKEEATAVWRAWLQAEPGNVLAEHHLRACTGEDVPARAADAYVQRVFDGFAASFDAKLASLSYRAPQLVTQAVARHGGAPQRDRDVLDAGCGTGLCAPLLAPWARHLAGVDLSAGMLEKARARGGYDELVQGELVAFLRERGRCWDLIVSADTLCYFGALEAFAAAAAASLRPQGRLVFTVEALDAAGGDAGADHRLLEHGRYSHRRGYVQGVLQAAGLDVLEISGAVLRTEGGEPVHGWVVAAAAH